MNIENMQLSVHDAIKNSVMTKQPLVIVEGKEDLSIYRELASEVSKRIKVMPVEYYKGCSPGCFEIEKRVEEINNIYGKGHVVYNTFFGIVDLDAKSFRGEVKNIDGIFYLQTYSFENSFVNERTLLSTVRHLTNLTSEELNSELTETMLHKINKSLKNFYYVTLEALKNAVETDYDGLIGFSDGYETALHNPNIQSELKKRSVALDKFAKENGLECTCIFNLGSFCKGKWHLQYFVSEIKKYVLTLHKYCGDRLTKCPYCEIGKVDNCLYKVKNNIDVAHMIKFMKSDLNNADLDYVKLKMSQIAA